MGLIGYFRGSLMRLKIIAFIKNPKKSQKKATSISYSQANAHSKAGQKHRERMVTTRKQFSAQVQYSYSHSLFTLCSAPFPFALNLLPSPPSIHIPVNNFFMCFFMDFAI
jgi:hypothetical protein